MGLYDRVRYSAACPRCARMLTEWQSKDHACVLDTIEPWQVPSFHAICDGCGAFVVASVQAEIEVKSLVVSLAVTPAAAGPADSA